MTCRYGRRNLNWPITQAEAVTSGTESELNKDKEIAGGVAVNEKNLLVKEMDKEKITTQAGILHYNML